LPSTKSLEPYHVNHYWFPTLVVEIGKFNLIRHVLCSTIIEMQSRIGAFEVNNFVY